MRKIPFGYACVFGMLIAGILACLAWCAWAILTRGMPNDIPAGAVFVKEVVRHALA